MLLVALVALLAVPGAALAGDASSAVARTAEATAADAPADTAGAETAGESAAAESGSAATATVQVKGSAPKTGDVSLAWGYAGALCAGVALALFLAMRVLKHDVR